MNLFNLKHKQREFIFVICLLILSLILFSQTFQYTRPAQLFPFILFGFFGILILIKTISYFNANFGVVYESKKDFLGFSNIKDKVALEKKEKRENIKMREEVLFVIIWLISFLIAIYIIGFKWSIFLFPIVFLKKMNSNITWPKIISISLGLWALIYLIFVILLNVPFSLFR